MNDPCSMEYPFADVDGTGLLLVGLGGGCGIIPTYPVSRSRQLQNAAKLIYGNTKRRIDKGLQRISPDIYRVPPPAIEARLLHLHTDGTTRVDQSVPRGGEGSPPILLLPRELNGEMQLITQIRALDCDPIFAVDTGRDSIVREAASGPQGRDRAMLGLLQTTDLPLMHVVVGPPSDGESCYEDLKAALAFQVQAARWRGSFSLDPLLPILREFGVPWRRANRRTSSWRPQTPVWTRGTGRAS